MSRLALMALFAASAVASADDTPPIRDVPGEVIQIEGRAPSTTPPKPTNFVKTKAPPYSERAILSDAWTKAWLLLELDETGAVTRIKFLNKPGYDLEQIAIAEAFKLKFTPALDGAKQPMRSALVWEIEWPSAYWLSTFEGTRSKMPAVVGFPPRRRDHYVPCRGSGPWAMGSIRPTYKDCSKPDLSQIKTAPWIERPAPEPRR
ncbi:MAG: hypothetical protein JNL83_07095 [Myxococcales bacterium]|nr:hypothetical protein [Myxococcales bacterium]